MALDTETHTHTHTHAGMWTDIERQTERERGRCTHTHTHAGMWTDIEKQTETRTRTRTQIHVEAYAHRDAVADAHRATCIGRATNTNGGFPSVYMEIRVQGPLTHSLTHSLTYSLTHSLAHSLTHSLSLSLDTALRKCRPTILWRALFGTSTRFFSLSNIRHVTHTTPSSSAVRACLSVCLCVCVCMGACVWAYICVCPCLHSFILSLPRRNGTCTPAEPATTRTLPADYVERVRAVHTAGGHGSLGYRSEWKLEEAQKNILRTHTTAVSARMLYRLAQEVRPRRPHTGTQAQAHTDTGTGTGTHTHRLTHCVRVYI
jgi:hypothetical protein